MERRNQNFSNIPIPIIYHEGRKDGGGSVEFSKRIDSPPVTSQTSSSSIGSPVSKSVRFVDQKDTKCDQYWDDSKKYYHMELHESSLSSMWSSSDHQQMSPGSKGSSSIHPQLLPRRKWGTNNNNNRGHPQRQVTLRKIMLDRSLNVENLVIGEHQKVNLEPHDEIYLPAVKTFSWHATEDNQRSNKRTGISRGGGGSDDGDADDDQRNQQRTQMAYKILLACPNLEVVKDFHFDTDFDIVIAARKVRCVETLCLFDTVNSAHLMDFIEAKPRVKILQLINTGADLYPEERRRVAWVIKKLFLTIQSTLCVLDLSQFCSAIEFQIPCPLPLVHQLTIGNLPTINVDPGRCLPRHIFLQEIFPNLRVLDCSRLQCEVNSNWDLYFPPENFQGSWASVQILVISDHFTHFFMDKIQRQLCPNFVKLIVHSGRHESYGSSSGLVFVLAKIFRFWSHLQYLELRLDEFPSSFHSSFSMDSAFTGLTEETCKRLRIFGPKATIYESMKGMDKSEMERASGVRPSIANLQRLKNLDIIFDHKCLKKLATHPEDYPVHLLSFVSGRFGFSLVPGLKVSIYFDDLCPWGKELLKKFETESLAPYVSFRPLGDCTCDENLGKNDNVMAGEDLELGKVVNV